MKEISEKNQVNQGVDKPSKIHTIYTKEEIKEINKNSLICVFFVLGATILGAILFWHFDIPTGAKFYVHFVLGGVIGFLGSVFNYILITSAT